MNTELFVKFHNHYKACYSLESLDSLPEEFLDTLMPVRSFFLQDCFENEKNVSNITRAYKLYAKEKFRKWVIKTNTNDSSPRILLIIANTVSNIFSDIELITLPEDIFNEQVDLCDAVKEHLELYSTNEIDYFCVLDAVESCICGYDHGYSTPLTVAAV